MPNGNINTAELQSLYGAVSTKFEVGTFDEFASKMDTKEKRQKFYNAASDKFDIGDYNTFEQRLLKKKPTPEPSVVGELPSKEPEPIAEEEEFVLEPVEEVREPEVEPAPPPTITTGVPEFIPEEPTEVPTGLPIGETLLQEQREFLLIKEGEAGKTDADRIKDLLEKDEPTGELTFMDKIGEIETINLIPFLSGVNEATQIAELLQAANRLDDDTASDKDVLLLLEFINKGKKETSFWYDVMNVVAELPAFAGELLATGGIYTAVKKATIKGSTTLLKKLLKEGGEELVKKKAAKITTAIAGGIAGATVQTPVAGITRIWAGTLENTMPEFELTIDEQNQISGSITKPGDNVYLSTVKALGDQWIETLSEKSGGLFRVAGRAGKEVMLRHGLLRGFLKANPTAKTSDFMKIVRRSGYDGIIAEMGEERLGEVGRAALGLDEWELPTSRQLLVELVSFSIPGLAISAANTATTKGKIKYETGEAEKEIEAVLPTVVPEVEEKVPVPEKPIEKPEEKPVEEEPEVVPEKEKVPEEVPEEITTILEKPTEELKATDVHELALQKGFDEAGIESDTFKDATVEALEAAGEEPIRKLDELTPEQLSIVREAVNTNPSKFGLVVPEVAKEKPPEVPVEEKAIPLEIPFPEIKKLEEAGDIEGIKEEIKKDPEMAAVSPLIGMDIKGTNSFIADLPKKTVSFFQKYFTSRGFLPENVFQEKIKMEGATRAAMKQVEFTAKDFKGAFNKMYKGEEKVEGATKIDSVLKGEEAISSLPEELHETVSSMRNQIDLLSKRLVTDGVVEGELAGKVMDNLGVYMTRTYKTHDAPTQWLKFIETNPEGQEIKNKAISHIRKRYEKMGEKVTDEEIDGIINDMLYKEDAPLNILSGGKIGSKDLSVLKRRKEIAPEIRALMGEYTDPLLNYARSISKMSSLIESHKFLNKVKDIGMDKFLFEKPTSTHFSTIAAEGSATMAPLNGLYTTPEIKEAFENLNKQVTRSAPFQAYMAINGFVKYSKTILSLMTHIRNVVGNLGFVTMNAHTSVGKFKEAIQVTINNLAKLDKKDFRERYIKYLKLGVVYESANAGELSDIIKDASGKEGDFERIFDGRVKKLVKAGNKIVTSVYMAEDDVFKIYAFENELARYKKVYPEKDEAEVEKIAANIVRNTYPTYSLVPEGIKVLRRTPLIGTFVSFPAEVVRTTYNTIDLAINEMKNPATRSIGIKRATGIMTAASGTATMTLLSRTLYNILEGDDDDVRRFVAPWTKNSQLLYLGYLKNGKVKYVDIGYSDPHNYLKNPVIAMLSEGDLEENGIEALKEFFEPFLGEEILAGKLVDIYKNTKPTGAPITNKQLPIGDQLADYTEYLAKALEPGTVTSFKRIWRGIHGKENEQGKVYDPATEVTALFSGQRVSELDVAQSLSFKLFRFTRDLSEANRIYNKVVYRRGKVSPEEIEDAYNKANTAREKLFQEINKDYQAALRLDVKQDVLDDMLKRQRISAATIQSIKTGVYKPLKKKGKPGEVIGEEVPVEEEAIVGEEVVVEEVIK